MLRQEAPEGLRGLFFEALGVWAQATAQPEQA